MFSLFSVTCALVLAFQNCGSGFKALEPTGLSNLSSDGGTVPVPVARNLSADRSLFFGESRCQQGQFTVCEDFESGAVSNQWTIVGNSLTVDDVESARGQKALHILQMGKGGSYILHKKMFPVANNSYYGRMFVRFKTLPMAPMTFSHWTMMAASGTDLPGEIRLGSLYYSNTNFLGVGTDTGSRADGTGDWTNVDRDVQGAGVRAIPVDEWSCYEWHHDGLLNETHTWWDGVAHPSLDTTSSKHGGNSNPFILPTFTQVWVGFVEYQPATQPFELWIDEVALDSKRIGCVD